MTHQFSVPGLPLISAGEGEIRSSRKGAPAGYTLYKRLMKDIPDKSIDMILCDLPYGTTSCKWDTVIPFELLWEQYNRITKPTSAIVLFSSQPFTSMLITSNIKQFRKFK